MLNVKCITLYLLMIVCLTIRFVMDIVILVKTVSNIILTIKHENKSYVGMILVFSFKNSNFAS